MSVATREVIERFTAEASMAGAMVYEARSAAETNDYILKLAQEHQAKRVVKAKSALAKEIGLRDCLARAGLEVTETDLGDWLVQLAGEKALNPAETAGEKTLEHIAALVSIATGEKVEAEPSAILQTARRALRQSYITADMGISEADLAIAETGTVVMLCNEGNSRLVSVLPLIHVTLLDSAALVPTLDAAVARLKSLARDKSDGRWPSYITYLTGRNTTGDIPEALMARAQGPAEEHIVLVNQTGGTP
jgi:L-lactate utilization protein LutB